MNDNNFSTTERNNQVNNNNILANIIQLTQKLDENTKACSTNIPSEQKTKKGEDGWEEKQELDERGRYSVRHPQWELKGKTQNRLGI